MRILQGFSDKERVYSPVPGQQKSIENRMRALLTEVDQARAAKEAAQAEVERLKTLLQSKG